MKRPAPTIWRALRSRPRLVAGFLTGIAALRLLPTASMSLRAVLAWDIGITIYLLLALSLFLSERNERMSHDAKAQEEGEWTVFIMTIAAAIFSLVVIIMEFSGIRDLPAQQRGWHVALVGYTLVMSWLMTHVTFGFRYAHEYYSISPGAEHHDGGLEFPGETRPDYLDFMYFTLILGMTFQVSDVQITSRKFRRMATLQGLIGFAFNTVILALTVNLVAGLL